MNEGERIPRTEPAPTLDHLQQYFILRGCGWSPEQAYLDVLEGVPYLDVEETSTRLAHTQMVLDNIRKRKAARVADAAERKRRRVLMLFDAYKEAMIRRERYGRLYFVRYGGGVATRDAAEKSDWAVYWQRADRQARKFSRMVEEALGMDYSDRAPWCMICGYYDSWHSTNCN